MELKYRSACIEDLESLVLFLADDPLGATREDTSLPINAAYVAALNSIDEDPNNQLLVAELARIIHEMASIARRALVSQRLCK